MVQFINVLTPLCERRTAQRWERGVDLYQLIIHVLCYKNFSHSKKRKIEANFPLYLETCSFPLNN